MAHTSAAVEAALQEGPRRDHARCAEDDCRSRSAPLAGAQSAQRRARHVRAQHQQQPAPNTLSAVLGLEQALHSGKPPLAGPQRAHACDACACTAAAPAPTNPA